MIWIPLVILLTTSELAPRTSAEACLAGEAAGCCLAAEAWEGAGHLQRALSLYEHALRLLAGEAGAPPEVADAVDALRGSGGKGFPAGGGTALATDLYRGSIPTTAAEIESQTGRARIRIAALVGAGTIYLQQGQGRQATDLYRRALAVAEQAGDRAARAGIAANLAWAALKDGRLDDAARAIADAGTAEAGPEVARELRRARLALGVTLREQGRHAEAIAAIEAAVPLYAEAGDAVGHARATAHLATALAQAGQLEAARERYADALRRNEAQGDHETAWHAHAGLARVLERLGRPEEALVQYERFVEIVERLGDSLATDEGRTSFLEDKMSLFEGYARVAADVAVRAGRPEMGRDAVERVRERVLPALQRARGRGARAAGHMPAGEVVGWHPALRRRENMAVQSAAGVEVAPPNMAAGVFAVDPSSMDAASAVHTPDGDTDAEPPGVPPPPATFLEYYVLEDRTLIAVHSPRGTALATAPLGAAALERLVRGWAAGVRADRPRGVRLEGARGGAEEPPVVPDAPPDELARRLYAQLVKPLEALLPQSADEALVIVPHRALWRLPFAVLQDERGRLLADRWLHTYAPSEQVWRATAGRARTSDHRSVRAWVVGNPEAPFVDACGERYHLDPLPHAQREAEAIAQLLGDRAELFTRQDADRLRLEAWHPEATVLHLASHGIACEGDPLGSVLALAELTEADTRLDLATGMLEVTSDPRRPVVVDGAQAPPLPGGETSAINVSWPGPLPARTIAETFRLSADLVALSACQSGLGRSLGQGTIGFTHAFLAAGARSLLVSLWSVDDRATRQLMVDFYREYLEHGNKALALQRAMAAARRRDPNPRTWAAFTLVGMAQ